MHLKLLLQHPALTHVLQTYDFTPLDSEAQEHKFYVPGIGLIVEVDLTTGDRVELIEFSNTP